MPALTRALDAWDGRGVPDEPTFALLAAGLREAQRSGQLGTVARRLNFAQPEFRSLLMRTARQLPAAAPSAWKPALVGLDERWNAPETWRLLKRAAASPTPDYLLAAVDA
jgi:putative spermidine/putrescine transport system permease protein